MRKLVTYAVVVATIVWSLGLAAVVPASAAYTPMAGDLIKTATDSAVYYIDASGKRNLFVNAVTFWTWYSGSWSALKMGNDSMTLKVLSQEDFDALTSGTHATVRPGTKLIKFQNSPKVYVVSTGNVLREVSDAVAKELFGADYATKKLITIQNGFETDYSKGAALASGDALPDGSLIKYTGSEDIYYIQDGMKRMVSSDAFIANGFMASSVVTVATSMSYDAGDSITSEEAALTTVAGSSSTTTPPTTSGPLSAALASNTPAAGLAIYSAVRVPFTTVALTAGSSDAVVDSITVERQGPAADSVFSTIALIDADTNVQIGVNQSLNASSRVIFGNNITVKAGTTKKILVAGNMAATGAGTVPMLAVVDITLEGGSTLNANLPIVGNGQTVTALTIGQATVQRGSYMNSTSTSLKVGTEDYIIAAYKFSADSVEGQNVKQIKFYQSGTASLTSDLEKYKLLVDNSTVVNATFTVDGKYITADFTNSPVYIEKGKSKQLVLRADVIGGSTRTIKMDIYRNSDIVSAGSSFGYNRAVAVTGTGASGSSPILSNDQYTISAGTLTISSNNVIPAQDVSYGDSQELGAFQFSVKGEAIDISALTLAVSSTTAGSDTFDDVKLVDSNGKTLWGPSSPSSGSVAFTSNVQLPVGDNIIKVVADVVSTGGFASNETFNFSITGSTVTASGASTGDTVTASPTTAVNAYTQTFKSAKLTVTANALPTDGTVVIGTKDYKFASWRLNTTGSGEDVKLTSIIIANQAGTTSADLTNIRLINADNSNTVIDTDYSGDGFTGTTTFTFSTPIIIAKNSSLNLEVWADVANNSAGGGHVNEFVLRSDGTVVPVTAEGNSTGNTITPSGSAYNATDGADITISSVGTLTVENADGAPSSKIVAEGQTYEFGRINLKATNEAIDVTNLSICVGAGAVTGTATGDKDDITTVSVYRSDTMAKIIDNQPINAICEAFYLAQGALQVPKTSSGLDLIIKATLSNVDNASVDETGLSNASLSLGIGGTDGITSKGAQSGTTITETFNSGTSSAMILHKAYPTVTINTPAAKLAGGAALYDFTVNNPTAETIALYRLSFNVSTSSGDIDVTSGGLEAKRSDWASFKKIAVDSAGTISATTNDRRFTFALWNPDSTTETSKESRIASGQSAQFRFIGRTITGLDGTAGESLEVVLLGDTTTTTVNGVSGNPASSFVSGQQGNFVWSDLYSSTAATATSTSQWYNGYLIEGLSSTTTPVSIPE